MREQVRHSAFPISKTFGEFRALTAVSLLVMMESRGASSREALATLRGGNGHAPWGLCRKGCEMIETVLNSHATVGESATWVPDERALYWIDVKAPALYRYHPADETRSWELSRS